MNRVMEGGIQLPAAAKYTAGSKSMLFGTGREGLLLRFALSIMYLWHRDAMLDDQGTHKDTSPANVMIVLSAPSSHQHRSHPSRDIPVDQINFFTPKPVLLIFLLVSAMGPSPTIVSSPLMQILISPSFSHWRWELYD